MTFDRIKKILAWVTIAPLIILGYGQLAGLVYFIDWVQWAQDILTKENVELFAQLITKMDYALEQIERLRDFHE